MQFPNRTRPLLGPLPFFAIVPLLVLGQDNPTKPVYISGQVALSDGSQQPGRIAIERVCPSHIYQEGYADSKGHFYIQLGTLATTVADASFNNEARFGQETNARPIGGAAATGRDPLLWGCNIQAALKGYHSNTIPLDRRDLTSNPDIGTLILTRMDKVEGYTISATVALAPKDAKKAYEKGLDLEHHAKVPGAQKEFERAVALYPKHAGAWYELGRIYEHENQTAQARDAYQRAMDADPNYVNPYERMYLMAIRENKWREAADLSDKVLRLDRYEFGGAYYYNAMAHLELHELDIAEMSAREAVKQTGKDAAVKAPYMLALVLANKGNYREAAENFRAYLKVAPPGAERQRAEKMLADVEQRLQASK